MQYLGCELKPIENAEDEAIALRTINKFSNSDDPDHIQFVEMLQILVDNARYETNEELDIPLRLRVKIESYQLKQKDIAPIFNGKTRISEILSGKRKLNLKIIYNLNKYLNIPYSQMIDPKEYSLPSEVDRKIRKLIIACWCIYSVLTGIA